MTETAANKVENTSNEPAPISASSPLDTTSPATSTPMETTTEQTDVPSTTASAPPGRNRVKTSTKRSSVHPSVLVHDKPKTEVKTKAQSHPPFFEMITQAIRNLNDRGGSSRQAILKFITANYKVEPKSGNQHVKVGLKNAVKAGTLKQVKGVGASGSFKLSDALKSKEKLKVKAETKPTKSAKKMTKKKTPAKKVTAAVAAKKLTMTATKSKVPAKKQVVSKTRTKGGERKVNSVKTSATPVAAKKPKVVKKTVTKVTAKAQTKASTTMGRSLKDIKAPVRPVYKKTGRKSARKCC